MQQPTVNEEDPEFDELNCIRNFKMVKRCSIPMGFNRPRLVDCFAEYFVVAGYEDKPFQVDIFEKNKSLTHSFDVQRAAKLAFLQQ